MATGTANSMVRKLDKLRFAVGTEGGPRSAFWFIKIEKTGDVYVSSASIAGQLKLSLHRDRSCQFGMVGTSRSRHLSDPQATKPHYFFKWNRPETPTQKAQHVASIIFPTLFLNQSPEPIPVDNKLRCIFLPSPEGHALEFGLYYSLISHDILEGKFLEIGHCPIIHRACNTGETISVAACMVPFDPANMLAETPPEMMAQDDLQAGFATCGKIASSAILAGDPHTDGYIRLLDISRMTLRARATPSA